MLPVITTNGASGLIVGAVTPSPQWVYDYNLGMWVNGCMDSAGRTYTDGRAVFSFPIVQQAFAPNTGVITISNININVNADAPNGPVITHVFKGFSACSNPTLGGPQLQAPRCISSVVNPGVDFGAYVSNAKIGIPVAAGSLTAGTALGVTATGPFSAPTKVAALKHYITWQFQGGASLVGKSVQIWVASKSGGVWGPFVRVTSRAADISGNVYYYLRSSSASWLSIRAYFPGDSSNAAAWSPARQGRWK